MLSATMAAKAVAPLGRISGTRVEEVLFVIVAMVALIVFLIFKERQARRVHRNEMETRNRELARLRGELDQLHNRLSQAHSPGQPQVITDEAPSRDKDGPATEQRMEMLTGIDDEFLEKFVDTVEADISNPDLSVEVVASRLGMSRVQLYRKIKASTNYSAAEMIRLIRLRHAVAMLTKPGMSVSQVAYAVGFSSASYFSRSYKEYFKESPTQTLRRVSNPHGVTAETSESV